jgi:hypothetical protein
MGTPIATRFIDIVQKRVIRGKSVYIFESHNFALSAWAEIKGSHPTKMILITLDYHTDTEPAFKRHTNDGRPKLESRWAERISQIDLRDEQSVFKAATDLFKDEQIDAAIRLNLFSAAFCFNEQGRNTTSSEEDHDIEPDWGCLPEDECPNPIVLSDGIFVISEAHASRWVGRERAFADQAIEADMLGRLIARANHLAGSISVGDIREQPFVLDIDLDYFMTADSLAPKDPAVFHRLIKAAKAITIATEPAYVCKLSDKELTAEYVLEKMVEHINRALAA